jgi:uncharacterized membrane protein SirB2
MEYLLLKQVHVVCASLSIAGFALRGALMLRASLLLQSRLARVAPHIVDTVLLASASALASCWRWSPMSASARWP